MTRMCMRLNPFGRSRTVPAFFTVHFLRQHVLQGRLCGVGVSFLLLEDVRGVKWTIIQRIDRLTCSLQVQINPT